MPVICTLREFGNENVTPERREHLKPDRPGVNAQVDRESWTVGHFPPRSAQSIACTRRSGGLDVEYRIAVPEPPRSQAAAPSTWSLSQDEPRRPPFLTPSNHMLSANNDTDCPLRKNGAGRSGLELGRQSARSAQDRDRRAGLRGHRGHVVPRVDWREDSLLASEDVMVIPGIWPIGARPILLALTK